MKQPPTERHRAIAMRRAEGLTLKAVGEEFGLRTAKVNEVCKRVENYDHGVELLHSDPGSVEGLALMGRIKPMVLHTLRYRGIQRIADLDGVTMEQLLRWPNIGRRSAMLLLGWLSDLKKGAE